MATAQQRQSLGRYGERLAERHLTELGYVVLDRNWRCRSGELDLVLRDGRTLVVCEVKTRRGVAQGHPLACVDAVKVERLQRLALLWADGLGLTRVPIRVDVVGVLLPYAGSTEIEHVRGIG
jgi:putative endonuclease